MEGSSDELKGLVFHIIHGSFVDGYGLRTTVFLKGCPLSCLWCCNPEGQKGARELKYAEALCNGCGRCLKVCPSDSIKLVSEQGKATVRIDRATCNNCGKCIEVCFTGALDFFGKYYTVDELFKIIKKDEVYYSSSGGGVTIGGGEPTVQAPFVRALLSKCRENYINTALDTCGYTTTEDGMKALEEADLLLWDIKGMNPNEHFKNTGVYPDTILSNLKRMGALGKSIIIRIPLIPGYNDSLENIQATGELLSQMKSIERVDLLAYHEYGTVKYSELGRPYPLKLKSQNPEELNQTKALLEQYGLKVQLGG